MTGMSRTEHFAAGVGPRYHLSLYDTKGNQLLHEPDVTSDSLRPVGSLNEAADYVAAKKMGHTYDEQTGKFGRKRIGSVRLMHDNGKQEEYPVDKNGMGAGSWVR
jgi:hypothetical protein